MTTPTSDKPPVIGLLTGPTLLCPVDGCEWHHTPDPEPVYDATPLDAIMGAPSGSINALQQQRFMARVERQFDQHVRTHSARDWVETVARLKKAAGEMLVIT